MLPPGAGFSMAAVEEVTVAEHYDVIIIGTGAGGGTLAHTLAPSGKRILLLERGISCPGRWTTGIPSRCS